MIPPNNPSQASSGDCQSGIPRLVVFDIELKITLEPWSGHPSRLHLSLQNQSDTTLRILEFQLGYWRSKAWPLQKVPLLSNMIRYIPRLTLKPSELDRVFFNVYDDDAAITMLSRPPYDEYSQFCGVTGTIIYRSDAAKRYELSFFRLQANKDDAHRYEEVHDKEREYIVELG